MLDKFSHHVRVNKIDEKYREQYLSQLKKGRAVHNSLMEMRGNIRVFCRVRPPSGGGRQGGRRGRRCS